MTLQLDEGDAEAARPQPVVFSQQIRAERSEVPQIGQFIADSVAGSHWNVEEFSHYADWQGTGRPGWSLTASQHRSRARYVLTPAHGRHLQLPEQYSLGVTADVTSTDQRAMVQRLVSALPLTDLEFGAISDDMPLTASIAARLPDWIPSLPPDMRKPLDGYGAIFTIHHQTDFLLLLDKALELGIDRSLVTVIDKQYQYRWSERVDATIKDRLGVKVFTYSQLTSAISDHISRVAAHQSMFEMGTWARTVVLDDGGYVLPELHRRFRIYLNLFQGVVEQTQSGIWALRPFEADLRVPIFSVAESDLKRTVEAHGVALAAVTNLRNLLPNEKFTGRRAVVIGYGRLGKALTEVLQAFHFSVSVAESDSATRVMAREDGVDAGRSAAEVIARARPHYVFACAGRLCFGQEEIGAIENPVYVVSLTSRDFAVDKEWLGSNASVREYGSVGKIYDLRGRPGSIFLIADGFPINFHHAESMPNRQSDLVMSSLLVGAAHLCAGTPRWPAGNDPARANFSLNEGTLLEDFFNV